MISNFFCDVQRIGGHYSDNRNRIVSIAYLWNWNQPGIWLQFESRHSIISAWPVNYACYIIIKFIAAFWKNVRENARKLSFIHIETWRIVYTLVHNDNNSKLTSTIYCEMCRIDRSENEARKGSCLCVFPVFNFPLFCS